MKKTFKRNALSLDLPHFTPYTIRHFMATNVRRVDGVTADREQRQEWLGHKRQDTTSWYEHHDPEWLSGTRPIRSSLGSNGMLKNERCFQIAPKLLRNPGRSVGHSNS